jgi:hypothetical protein
MQNARGISGGVDQQFTPRWLAGCVTRKTGTVGSQGGAIHRGIKNKIRAII